MCFRNVIVPVQHKATTDALLSAEDFSLDNFCTHGYVPLINPGIKCLVLFLFIHLY